MNNSKKYLWLPLVVVGLFINGCEEKGLSEEEIVNLASKTSSVYVSLREQGNDRPVEGATITMLLPGGEVSVVTNESGLAFFDDVDQGTVRVKVTKDGFFDFETGVSIFTDGRGVADNIILRVYNKAEASIIRGVVQIQTDLTTQEPEYPDGVPILALANGTLIAEGKTNSNGEYEIAIPTSRNGRSILLSFPDLTFDQKIAVVGESGVEIRTAKGTVFSMDRPAQQLPNTANIQLFVRTPNFGNSRQAYVNSVTVEAGEIVNVELGDIGFGYSGTSFPTIDSPDGGSGASVRLRAGFRNEFVSCGFPDYYRIYETTISNGGTGYPDYVANQNVSTTHPEFRWPNCRRLENRTYYIRSNEVLDIDVNYGTGTVTGDIE